MRRILYLTLLAVASCGDSDGALEEKFQQANQLLTQQNHEAALTLYNEVLAARPDFIKGLNNRGIVHTELGNYQLALADFDQILDTDPSHYDAWFNKTATLWAMGRWRSALEYLEELAQREDKAQIYFRMGLIEVEQGLMSEALDHFRSSWIKDPSDLLSAVNMANTAYYLDQFPLADSLINQVLSKDSKNHEALNTKSLLHLQSGDLAGAEDLVKQAIDLAPKNAYYINNLGRINLEMDSLARAEELINQSMLQDSENPWVYRNKAQLYLKMGDLTKAHSMLDRAQNLAQSFPIKDLHYLRGRVFELEQRASEACDAWKKGAEMGDAESAKKWQDQCS